MRGLKSRVHPVTVVLTLVVLGVAIFMVYSRKMESQSPPTQQMMQPMPQPVYDESLGVMLNVSREPKGDKIITFRPSREASVLGLLGCMPGDVLVSVNGNPVSGGYVRDALDALKKNGTPLVLVVYRNGQKIELKHTKVPTEPPPLPPGLMPPSGR